MARYIYEFFRPRVSLSVVFPIGVIAQDRDGVVYRTIPDVPLPDDVDLAFYGIHDRERFMNEDFLHRVEASDPESGAPTKVPPTDPQLLTVLRQRGSHHFLYGSVRRLAGTAEEVADEEAERLAVDVDARRKLVIDSLDPTTQAALDAYA
jgi:hypothetical protein